VRAVVVLVLLIMAVPSAPVIVAFAFVSHVIW
jgi:hypothetical protein